MGAFLGVFALFLVTGVPIALALGIAGVAFLWFSGNETMVLELPQRMMAGVNQFVLLTIPLFLLAGTLMNAGGITDRIVDFARATVGHRRGGMSSVTVLSAGFFSMTEDDEVYMAPANLQRSATFDLDGMRRRRRLAAAFLPGRHPRA